MPAESFQMVEILITDDIFCESEQEDFFVDLTSFDGRVLLSEPRSSTVTILEDDSMYISFVYTYNYLFTH